MIKTLTLLTGIVAVTVISTSVGYTWMRKHHISYVCAIGYVTFCGAGRVDHPVHLDANGNHYASSR